MTNLARTLVPVAAAAALLSGCATNPRASLPQVEAELASRTDARVAWPISDDDHAKTDAAVRELLTPELTIESAVQIALLNNRSLRATFEELGLSQADLVEAGMLPNPSLSFNVRWPHESPHGPHWEFDMAADVVHALMRPVRKRLAQAQVTAVERRVVLEVLVLVAEVRSAALSYLAERQLRERFGVIADVNDAAADLARRQFDAGNINRLELLQLQTASQQSQLEIARIDAALRAEREHLTRLLGLRGNEAKWDLTATLPALPADEPDFTGLEDAAVAQRLDLAAARTEMSLAEQAFNVERGTRYLPAHINLGGTAERESTGDRSHGPSIELEVPIFNQRQAEVMRLESAWRQARARYEALEVDIRSEVRMALDSLQTARNTAEYFTQVLLPQRRQILRETLLHYNAMQKSNYELLAAKSEQQEAERESIEALRDYWIARAELERALGGILPGGTPAPEPAPMEETPAEEPAHQHHH